MKCPDKIYTENAKKAIDFHRKEFNELNPNWFTDGKLPDDFKNMCMVFERNKAEKERKAREAEDKAYNKGLWESLPFYRKWLYPALKR